MINHNERKVISIFERKNKTTPNLQEFSKSTPDYDEEQEFENTLECETKTEYNINMSNNTLQELSNDVRELKAQNDVLKEQNNTTRWLIGILVTIFGIITPLLFTVYSGMTNAKFETISTKMDAINQRLDYQEKLNSIQIQRDVANEMKKK